MHSGLSHVDTELVKFEFSQLVYIQQIQFDKHTYIQYYQQHHHFNPVTFLGHLCCHYVILRCHDDVLDLTHYPNLLRYV